VLILLQATGPDSNIWLIILGIAGGAMSGVFGALLASQRTVNANLEKQVLSEQKSRQEAVTACEARERERVTKAEERETAALERLGVSTSIITGQTAAITEFGGVLKDTVAEIRRGAERSEASVREIADLKRESASLRETTVRETSALQKIVEDLRREITELVSHIRATGIGNRPDR
jgi:hypothetical protein